MNPIKVDINDLDKYFVKSELTPAIAFDVDTKTVLMLSVNIDEQGRHLF